MTSSSGRLPALLLVFAVVVVAQLSLKDERRPMLLTKGTVLSFSSSLQTVSGGRSPAQPQMTCRGQWCDSSRMPKTALCTYVGSPGNDQWTCEANMVASFAWIEVSCEGFASPDDAHILKGSCALSYELVQPPPPRAKPAPAPPRPEPHKADASWFYWGLFLVVFAAAVLLLASARHETGRQSTFRFAPSPRVQQTTIFHNTDVHVGQRAAPSAPALDERREGQEAAVPSTETRRVAHGAGTRREEGPKNETDSPGETAEDASESRVAHGAGRRR